MLKSGVGRETSRIKAERTREREGERPSTQAGVAELGGAVGVEEGEQLAGKVDPLLPLDQGLLHVWTSGQRSHRLNHSS